MTCRIDLNADIGEGMPTDAALIPLLTSCNIACGGHAGDERTMDAAIRAAMAADVAVGAHPSYPDRAHFGRRRLDLTADAIVQSVLGQTDDLTRVIDRYGASLTHVKLHGALYHDAATDPALAHALVNAFVARLGRIAVFGPPHSCLSQEAARADLRFVAEGFADRRYEDDGALRPRTKVGAVLESVETRVAQALSVAARGVPVAAGTLCLHGDDPLALATAAAVRDTLNQHGISVRRFDR